MKMAETATKVDSTKVFATKPQNIELDDWKGQKMSIDNVFEALTTIF
ncbi:hypothetical protein PC116_g18478 [Phytophthora cactorum]|nr:hypothetical protein PC119_g15352 [Phytophthora cactorum]KAG3152566.1 hypothetical protein C6341_g16246 [Phytophthora cactorum]KAG4233294.1 hypothetical protein PC116_g18478 [Phytophthora cactorum]